MYPINVHKLVHFKALVTFKVNGLKMLGKRLLIIPLKKQDSFGRFLFLVLIVDLQTFLKSKFLGIALEKNHSRQGLSADISSSIL